METVMATQQEGSVTELDTRQIQPQSESLIQVQEDIRESADKVEAVTSPAGIKSQTRGVIQTTQPSVIQSPQLHTTQVAAEDGGVVVSGTQKRREFLSRRPSYRQILNELSSDTTAVAKIEEEEIPNKDAQPSSRAATVAKPASIYQTSLGQIITITQDGMIQIGGTGVDSVPGFQAPQTGATVLQYTQQPGEPAQHVVLSTAATGDMPAYQIRSPSSGLPPGVVMAASPGAIHSPQQQAEEATRKREVRLMKNREAARECRRKKKEYVKCLENRVAVLENQNKTLIEELKALKDIYCHKPE